MALTHERNRPTKPRNSDRGRLAIHRGRAVSVAAGLFLAVSPAGAADWDFTPRVALGQTWTDNISLAADGFEESEWITEFTPGFLLEVEGQRVEAELNYDLQALWYADNSDFNDIYHQLDGVADFVLWPESLYLDTFARFDQENVDAAGPVAYSNLFETNNRTDTLVFGASPYHVARWGGWAESLLRYDYQTVRYSNTDEGTFAPEDSDTNGVTALFGSPSQSRGFSWRTSGSYTRTDFDESPEFEYARVALDVGVPVGLRTRVTATAGQESDVEEDSSAGGLDTGFWYVGLAWEPSELQSLEARVGSRFFGTAWEANWRRRGSRGELVLDYSEEPTTSSGVLGEGDVPETGFRPGGTPTLDTRVFLLKRFSANASYELTRSTLVARVYTDRRQFQDAAGGTEKAYGATLSYDWEAAVRTQVGMTLDWESREFEFDRQDDFGELTLRLTRQLSRALSGVLRASHFLRNSDAEEDYRVNQVSLSVEASF